MATPITIESRKFLASINDSAQAKVAVFERLIESLGNKAGQKWRLASLNGDKLFIENIQTKQFYLAEHKRQRGGRINIHNIRPVRVVEEKKQDIYEQNVLKLVDAIEENDQRGMRSSWNSIATHRFSSRTIPTSGVVKTRDGVVRTINVENDSILDEQSKAKLISALVESVTDQITLTDGQVIDASFNIDNEKRLPVSEWTCRRVVGNKMRNAASDAYLSEGFQKRIFNVAKFIEEDKIEEAVALVKNFLVEMQEFCLLTRDETKTLVENALAARAIFNQSLCDDVATLFYRTNMKVNRADILSEWRKTARVAEHPILLENVSVLERAKNFDSAYNTFLNMIFHEASSPRDDEIESYRQALDMLRNTQSIKEDTDLRSKLEELMMRLSESEVDDATVNVVRETLAAAAQEVKALEGLSDFDKMPGDSLGEDLGEELAEVDDEGGQPTININAPLIQIGGSSAGGGGEEELGDMGDMGGEEEELGGLGGEEEELGMGGEEEGLGGLGMGGEEEEEEEGLGGLRMGREEEEEDELGLGLESRKRGNALAESAVRKVLGLGTGQRVGRDVADIINKLGSKADELSTAGRSLRRRLSEDDDGGWEKPWLKDKDKDKDKDKGGGGDDDSNFGGKPENMEEDGDECYESRDPYAFDESNMITGVGADYGAPILGTNMEDVVRNMFAIAEERHLGEEDIKSNVGALAKEAMDRAGVRLPKNKIGEAVKAASDTFQAKLAEDQYKFLDNQQRGRANRAKTRSSFEKLHDTSGGGGGGGGEGGGESGDTETANMPGDKMEGKNIQVNTITEDRDNFGVLFEMNGVRFVLDYADPPQVNTPDNRVSFPVPNELRESAFAAAGVIDADPKPFFGWVARGLEQLRPISKNDDAALDEAVATLQTGPDGSINISIDSQDPNVNVQDVNELGDVGEEPGMEAGMEEPGMEAGMEEPGMEGPGLEAGMEDTCEEGMQPVTDIGAETGTEEPAGEDMPDFEGPMGAGDVGPEMGAGPEAPPAGPPEGGAVPPAGPPEGEEEVEESVVQEDNDITDPEKGDYNTADDELRDQSKQAGKSVPKGKGNKLDGFSGTPKKEGTGKHGTELKKTKPGENRP